MTNLEETALRDSFETLFGEAPDGNQSLWDAIEDYWIVQMDKREREEKSRIDSRLEYMFANAPETYWAIKQIIYS